VELENAEGLYLLAKHYQEGTQIERDHHKAIALHLRAANYGYPPSATALAHLYNESDLIERDPFEAYTWALCAARLRFEPDNPPLDTDALEKELSDEQIEAAKKRTDDYIYNL